MPGAMLATLILAAAETAPAAAVAEPKMVMDEAGFPYPSVSAAMDALLDNRDAEFTVKANWTSVTETVDGRPVHWSFTPEHHPAHPSVVRRTPIEKDGEIWVKMSYRCEAKPSACDALLQEFRNLNEATIREFKNRLGLLDHPRKAEAEEFADRWFELVEQSKDDETLALLTPYSRSGYTPLEWRRLMEEQRRMRGALTLRRLRNVNWYQNPPGVELEGTFAFMEFETLYDSGRYFVHYLVLHSDKGAPFRVMHDEAPFLRLRRVAKPQ
ncbi:MAG: DUF4019 domain-containing protein [Gammaproteobacteria bacterium]